MTWAGTTLTAVRLAGKKMKFWECDQGPGNACAANINPKPQTPNPKPSKPQTLNPKP